MTDAIIDTTPAETARHGCRTREAASALERLPAADTREHARLVLEGRIVDLVQIRDFAKTDLDWVASNFPELLTAEVRAQLAELGIVLAVDG